MDKFGYPTNIKQIGDVDEILRIYIEDYVYSYLLQYAEAGGNEERIAALVGRCMLIDGQTVLFINGAIQGKYAESENGSLTFSGKCQDYIDNQIEKYFNGLEVVGWLQSQPNYGNFLSASYAKYHVDNFKKPYQVMFVVDPVEKINSFFVWNNERTDILESKGFFVYYDKNKNMHNYILDNKIVKYTKPEPIEAKEQPIQEFIEDREVQNEKTISKKASAKRELLPVNFKNYTTHIASILFIVTIFMSANVINSNTRINKLEGDISNIRSAYNELVIYINEQGATPVFASNSENANITETEIVIEEAIPSSNTTVVTEEVSKTVEQVSEQIKEEPKSQVQAQKTDSFVSKTTFQTYTIRQGDSLISICNQVYGTDKMLDTLMSVNGITDPNKIYYGMVIKLPEQN